MTYERFPLDTEEMNKERALLLIDSLGPKLLNMRPLELLGFLKTFYEGQKALAQKIDSHFSSHEDKEARDDYSMRAYHFIAPNLGRLEQAIKTLERRDRTDLAEVIGSVGRLGGELIGMKLALEAQGQEF